MNTPSRDDLCRFVRRSVDDKQYNGEILFPLPPKAINRIQRSLPFAMDGYQFQINSHAVRHIKKGHPDDLHYICEIMEILEHFTQVKKSITRCPVTGANLVKFYKRYDNDTVKLVKSSTSGKAGGMMM